MKLKCGRDSLTGEDGSWGVRIRVNSSVLQRDGDDIPDEVGPR
jgi:hypothetical protein